MNNKVLIRKQAGGGLQYQVTQQGSAPKTSFLGNVAALRGGARGLVKDPNNPNNVRQGFIPGSQLGNAKPTTMQRLAAGANVAGTGLAAALTGLQTAYGLQGGNIGALGSIKDQFRANVGGLTGGSPTEAQQTQDMATKEYQERQREMARLAMLNQAQDTVSQRQNPTQVTQTAAPQQMTTQQTAAPQQISGSVAVSKPLQTPQGPYSYQTIGRQMMQQPAAPTAQPFQQTLGVGSSAPYMSEDAQLIHATSVSTDPNVSSQMQPNQTNASTTAEQFPYQPSLSQYQPSATTQTSLQDFSPQLSQEDQEFGQRFAAQSGFFQQGILDSWNKNRERRGLPPLTSQEASSAFQSPYAKSFVDYAYELHGDILRKANPHEAGLLVMNMYLEMLR